MRIFKPAKIGLLHRTLDRQQRFYLHIAALLYYPLDDTKNLLPEQAMWQRVPQILGETPLDEMVGKVSGEFLVAGSAFPPDGRPAPACLVRVKVGGLEKKLVAVGDRRWERGAPSEPEPFTEMPLDWKHAFGGEGFAKNPVGKGFAPVAGQNGKVHPLPNVELAGKLIRSTNDRPEPAGFMPLDLTWPQRMSKAGTYDRTWLEQDYPGLARNADWRFYNVAPEDQWLPGFFEPDASFEIDHMHPARSRIEGRLPNAITRAFVTQRAEGGERFVEVPMRLETLWLFPNCLRAVAIHRGVLEVAEDDADDIADLVLACEDRAAPRDEAHYREAREARLDTGRSGAIAALRDKDLQPDWPSRPLDETKDTMAALQRDGRLHKNMRKRMEREVLKQRAAVAALGLDPDTHGMPPPPPEEPEPETLEELDERFRQLEEEGKDQMARIEEARQQKLEGARKLFEAAGLDYSVVEREYTEPRPGPPKPKAPQLMATLERALAMGREHGQRLPDVEKMLEDDAYRERMLAGDQAKLDAYRRTAQHWAAAPRLDADAAADKRREVEARLAAGESLAAVVRNGAVLRGLDLSGVDLTEAFVESADLTGAKLVGATLTGAVLTRADLSGADLTSAKLERANLGAVRTAGTSFVDADLTGAILYQADLAGADLTGAVLVDADLFDAKLGGAILKQARLTKALFRKATLAGTDFSGADLEWTLFIECDVSGVDFSGAKLGNASFVMTRAVGARFAEAEMPNARIFQETDFSGADFHGARMPRCYLRATPLREANFSGAVLDGTDFSKCDLTRAKFVRADAPRARFVGADLTGADFTAADLMEAVLQKARLDGACLEQANLYQADLARIAKDGATSFEEANLARARIHPLRKHA